MKNESIIVCIPGKWQSIKEVAIGLATYSDYQLKGNMIFSRLDSNVYELHIEIWNTFVSIVEEQDYYTCGMHNFGLPDAITFKNQLDVEEAQWIMQYFCLYTILEQPQLNHHDTFGAYRDRPPFRLKRSECRHFDRDDLFYNQYGM